MEGEISEVAVAVNKMEKYEKLLEPLNLKNYKLGQLIRSNSMIHLIHVKGKRVLRSGINLEHDGMTIQKAECVNGREKHIHNWSYDEDWSFTIRKDQDFTGKDPMKNCDLTNFIHVTSKKALYYDDGKQSKDGKQSVVACRLFNDQLMGFQWYVNFVYSPFNDDEYLRSGTIIKINSGLGNLHSITNPSFFSNQDVFVNSSDADEEGNYPEDEDDFWVVLEREERLK